jgi:hypothetical protein
LPFWSTRVEPLWINVEQTTWIRQVLPGVGHDASRLVEIDFPQALPGHPGAAVEWDKAAALLMSGDMPTVSQNVEICSRCGSVS